MARLHADSSSSTLLLARWPLPNSSSCPRPRPLSQTSFRPLGVTASPRSLLHLYTDSRTPCLYSSYLYQPLDHRGCPARLHHYQQRNARIKQDWLSSGSNQSKFPFICGCPMRVLCFLYLSSASFQKRSRGSCLPWVPGTIPELSSHSKFKQ